MAPNGHGSDLSYENSEAKKRFKEAREINKSLSCLGDVLSCLQQKSRHVPYRNSTLTHVMKNALGMTAKSMTVAIYDQKNP